MSKRVQSGMGSFAVAIATVLTGVILADCGSGSVRNALESYLRVHPEISTTAATSLRRECPGAGISVEAIAALWGPPISQSHDGDVQTATWLLPSGVQYTAHLQGGTTTRQEVLLPEPWEEVAGRVGGVPSVVIEYLRTAAGRPDAVVYGLLRECPAKDMLDIELSLALNSGQKSTTVSGDSVIVSYMMGYEGQRVVAVLVSGLVSEWEFCAGAFRDRPEGDLCSISLGW